jgi:cobalt-precorrin 5A hydrolase
VTVVLGIGARSCVQDEDLDRAVGTLACDAVATLDRLGPLIAAFADRRGCPLLLFTAAELAGVRTPHVVRRTGAPSVAEASALKAAGPGATLLIPKTDFARVTIAVAGPVA